ncbi:MAG: DNA translocase FtsK, partial [Clostridia bacterium]|nr:DNA translocase FtsK [Clostridia bacterium]
DTVPEADEPSYEEEPVPSTPLYQETPIAESVPTRPTYGGFSFADADEEESEPAPEAPARGVKMTFGDVASLLDSEDNDEDMEDEQEQPVATPTAPAAPVRPAPAAPTTPRAPASTTPVRPAPAAPVATPPPAPSEYRRPPISLLNADPNLYNEEIYEEMEQTKELLRDTLASFDIEILPEITCSHGPTITRYEVRPAKGVRVRSILNRSQDISLNLSASSIRIEAPIPGKPAVGIELPNRERETVYVRTVLESDAFRNSTAPLEVPLGVDIGGDVRMCNIQKMPHLLVAGTSGSGKSVCINSILLSLICKTSPEDLRLILIDPKKVEFTPYNDIPHLYLPIISEMQYAAGALACAVQEMERRFNLIVDVGVRDIRGYNEITKNDPDREHLPYIIIVIDEFADLKMGTTNNDVENYTCRLAQKARAAGIHLIIGTQRPSVDVITGKLKGNIAARIAFKVRQQVDSRTILDEIGAESLVGYGDMLFSDSTNSQMIRLQGPFVGDEELERMLNYVRKHNDPVHYNQSFMEQIEAEVARAANAGRKGGDDIDDEDDDGEDPVFREALRLAIESDKIATSLLQRRLGVGYGRAAKIIDRMEMLGYVSPSEGGNKPRRVLITPQQYAELMMDGEEEFDDEF